MTSAQGPGGCTARRARDREHRKRIVSRKLTKKARFVCLFWCLVVKHVGVAATEELVERGTLEAKETAIHRPAQVSHH